MTSVNNTKKTYQKPEFETLGRVGNFVNTYQDSSTGDGAMAIITPMGAKLLPTFKYKSDGSTWP